MSSRLEFGGIFFVRGAEGNYAHWYKPAGGLYDGFLLSSANCFAKELHAVIDMIEEGRLRKAKALSARVSNVVLTVLQEAATLPFGNQFTNANKAIDHFFALGPKAYMDRLVRTVSGAALPRSLLEIARDALIIGDLMPDKGYME